MAVLPKIELEKAKRRFIRSNGQGGLTNAEDLRAYEQHVIDTLFHLTDTADLEKLIADLKVNISDIEHQITAIQSDVAGLNVDLADALTKIETNRVLINSNASDIFSLKGQVFQLWSWRAVFYDALQSLQTQIDHLKSKKAPVQTHFEMLTLSPGTTILVHNFDLVNPDAWHLSAKLDGEVVYFPAKTRNKDSIFLTVNQMVTLSIFLTAKLD